MVGCKTMKYILVHLFWVRFFGFITPRLLKLGFRHCYQRTPFDWRLRSDLKIAYKTKLNVCKTAVTRIHRLGYLLKYKCNTISDRKREKWTRQLLTK